ncbi:MAG: translocation/assembly module TamB domain-containing protein, partial [Gammaproteobacteria bacterium]
PVVLVLNDLTVVGMHVTTPQLAQPLQISGVDAVAHLDNRSWRVEKLAIDGQQLQAQAHGDWDFVNGERLDAEANLKLALPQQTPVSGKANIEGDGQQLRFSMLLQSPLQLRLDADVQDLFGAPRWQGKLGLTRLHLQDFAVGLPDIEAQGTAHFSGTLAGTDFEGELQAREPDTGDWSGQFGLRYQDAKLDVRQLELARTATHTRFQLKGTVDLAGAQPAPDLQGEWQSLALPLTGKAWLESPRGKLHVQSKAQHITLDLDGLLSQGGRFTAQGNLDLSNIAHPWQLTASAHDFHLKPASLSRPLPGFDWRLLAHGDTQHTQIENLTVTGFGGSLRLQGDYRHGTKHDWHATLTAQHLNPGLLFPIYPGDIGFKAQLSSPQGDTSRWSLVLESLQGSLRAAPVSATGAAQYIQGRWLFKAVKMRIDDDDIQFDGHLGRKTHIDWNIHAPELAALWPGLSGALDSDGSVELDGDNPATRFKLHATGLHYQDYAIAALDADVAMSNSTQTGEATLKVSDIVFDDTAITQLTANLNGSLVAHSLQLELSSPLGKLGLAGEGKFADDIWQGDLKTVTLEPTGAGTWQADTVWQPRLGVEGFTLPQACVVQATARACGEVAWQRQKWQANANLVAIPLHDLQALLPPGLEYAGSFAGTLQSSGDAKQHSVDLTATLSPGSIHNVIRHQRVVLLDYTHGDAHIHIDAAHTIGSLDWSLLDGGHLSVETRIAHGVTPALSGHIRGELHDFALIPALIPDVSGFEGKFNIDLALGGSASDPTFNGTASLSDGSIKVPRLGLNVTGVVLDLQGNGDHLALDGTANSGTGSLHWDSTAQKQNGVWHAAGHLNGKDFRAVDIPEAQVDISPTLAFKLDDQDISLDGGVEIPYAKLRPRNLNNTAQVSADQVIVGQNEAAQEDRWRIHAKVNASMGDKVDIKGFGLSGRIAGSVLTVDEPGHFTTGSGELQIVDGQYTAYGQRLSIERGRLMFNGGPISNPALDIRALRKPAHPETVVAGQSEQQVGVVVRGTLRDPNVSLFSDPPLAQSSLLSYLLTGQLPATPSQSPLLGQPSTDTGDALTYSGGEFLAQQVGNQIGLSDVSIQNVSTGVGTSTPSLFIGKYLSPRLYISYGTGLLQSINTVRIRYSLSTKWVLEAESGAANSADIIYTLEH